MIILCLGFFFSIFHLQLILGLYWNFKEQRNEGEEERRERLKNVHERINKQKVEDDNIDFSFD